MVFLRYRPHAGGRNLHHRGGWPLHKLGLPRLPHSGCALSDDCGTTIGLLCSWEIVVIYQQFRSQTCRYRRWEAREPNNTQEDDDMFRDFRSSTDKDFGNTYLSHETLHLFVVIVVDCCSLYFLHPAYRTQQGNGRRNTVMHRSQEIAVVAAAG